jgi:hypothetical protein
MKDELRTFAAMDVQEREEAICDFFGRMIVEGNSHYKLDEIRDILETLNELASDQKRSH